MKIIRVDNFDRDTVPDFLVASGVNKFYGERIVDYLNERFGGNNSPDYYRLVEDDHKLYTLEDIY